MSELNWGDLSLQQRAYKLLKCEKEPSYFLKDPYFLGLEPWPAQEKLYNDFYLGGYQNLVFVGGFESSKSTMAGFFGLYELKDILAVDWRRKLNLLPESQLFVTLCSISLEQAKDAIWPLTVAKLMRSPFFQYYQPEELSDMVVFKRAPNTKLRLLSSYSATAVGRRNKAVCIDEMARFVQTRGPKGGWPVYNALRGSTQTFGIHGRMYVVGSPLEPTDILMQLHNKGLHDPRTLSIKVATWEFNPHKTRSDYDAEFLRDPLAAGRDFGAEPELMEASYYRNKDIIQFDTSRRNVLAMIYDGLKPKPESGFYVLTGDPAIKYDAFGICLAYRSGDTFIADGLFRFKPTGKAEINPTEVKKFLLKVVDLIPVRRYITDSWSYPELLQALRQKGISIKIHIVKKEDYDKFKNAQYEHKVILPYYEPLDLELRNLTTTGMKVDHPRGGSKDVADAAVNAYVDMMETQMKKPSLGLIEILH